MIKYILALLLCFSGLSYAQTSTSTSTATNTITSGNITNTINAGSSTPSDTTVNTGATNVGGTTVGGNSFKSTAFGSPSLSASPGAEPLQAFSIFGGVAVSQTEEYKVSIEILVVIKQMLDAGWITPEEARIEARNTYSQLRESSKPKRILGFLWKSRGRDLSNLFGTINWSSVYREGTQGAIGVMQSNKMVDAKKEDVFKCDIPIEHSGNKGIVTKG